MKTFRLILRNIISIIFVLVLIFYTYIKDTNITVSFIVRYIIVIVNKFRLLYIVKTNLNLKNVMKMKNYYVSCLKHAFMSCCAMVFLSFEMIWTIFQPQQNHIHAIVTKPNWFPKHFIREMKFTLVIILLIEQRSHVWWNVLYMNEARV